MLAVALQIGQEAEPSVTHNNAAYKPEAPSKLVNTSSQGDVGVETPQREMWGQC